MKQHKKLCKLQLVINILNFQHSLHYLLAINTSPWWPPRHLLSRMTTTTTSVHMRIVTRRSGRKNSWNLTSNTTTHRARAPFLPPGGDGKQQASVSVALFSSSSTASKIGQKMYSLTVQKCFTNNVSSVYHISTDQI